VNRQQGGTANTPPPSPVLAGEAAGAAGAAGAAPNTYTLTVPRTQQDIDAIRERRRELSNQLESAASRRSEIAEELKSLPEGSVRTGLEQRMAALDQRILRLEADIAETGRLLTSAPAGLLATTESPLAQFGIEPHVVERVSVMFTLFVLAPLAVGAAFLMVRRALKPAASRAPRGDSSERLERLETAVDAIAVEIERISEGQRFVTRLLTEASPQAAFAAREPASRIGARSETE
jgi:hypothetical protein